MRDFSEPFVARKPDSSLKDYRGLCLDILGKSDQPEAVYAGAQIRLTRGEYDAARNLLEKAASLGMTVASRKILALDMAGFAVRFPAGWKSLEGPEGSNATYILTYDAIIRSARSTYGEESRQSIVDDFVLGNDPVRENRLRAMDSLLGGAEKGDSAALAQHLIGRRLYEGSIESDILTLPSVESRLRRLLGDQSNFELLWWAACNRARSAASGNTDLGVYGGLATGADWRASFDLALEKANQRGVLTGPRWKFRQALFRFQNPNLAVADLTADISEVVALASLGYRDAVEYLEAAAVGQVTGLYSTDGFGLATDLCGYSTRLVLDKPTALLWWSDEIKAGNCDAINDLIAARQRLPASEAESKLPKVQGNPMRLLMTCRHLMNSHYLDPP